MSREKPAKKVKVEKTDGAKSTNGKRNEPAKIEAKMQNLKAKSGVKRVKRTKRANGANGASTKTTRRHPPFSEMVSEAFANMKNRKGHTLAAVKKYIAQNFDCELNKSSQNNIRNFISKEFSAGRIKMVNSEDNEIKFNRRFALVQ